MAHSLSDPPMGGLPAAQSYTLQEILQQPALWPTTVERVRAASNKLRLSELLRGARVVLTGAGTSFYAASAIAAAWPGAVAIPTTDLLIDAERYLVDVRVLIFLTRSGNSPESAALVEHVRALRPAILQISIVCDAQGALGRSPIDGMIDLTRGRLNGRSFAPTIAFSNLVLAGLALANLAQSRRLWMYLVTGHRLCFPKLKLYAGAWRHVPGTDRSPFLVSFARLGGRCWTYGARNDRLPLSGRHRYLSWTSTRSYVFPKTRDPRLVPAFPVTLCGVCMNGI